MRPLTAQQIVRIWEIGQSQHLLDRALTLLTFACPDQSPGTLATLSIGQRDGYLLHLRELTFGNKLNSFATCPHCGEKVESTMQVSDFRLVELQPPMNQAMNQAYTCHLAGFDLQFRLPNSWDLAAIAGQRDVLQAQSLLGQRCLLQASYNGQAIAYPQLPPEIIQHLSDRMAEYDPQAEILLKFDCFACEHIWKLVFDIGTFFWTELTAQAKRLLQEVHVLARFYGWREVDILAMSTTRRQLYLSLVS